MDGWFQRTNGWIGGDGAFSVPLDQERTLWLFSDTFVGEVREGKRVGPKMINNSIAVQELGRAPEIFVATNQVGEAQSFVKPANGEGYFWPFHGVATKSGVYMFLQQVKTIDTKSVFGFKFIGITLGHISAADLRRPPSTWKVTQTNFPFGAFTDDGIATFGCAVMKDGGFVYVYGVESRRDRARRGLVVGRVPEKKVGQFSAWRFFADGRWVKDFNEATPVCTDAPAECSVSYLPALKKYALVHSDGINGKIVVQLADKPVGPWREKRQVFQCHEMELSAKVFCYAGKAHPELASKGNELIITYASNSHNFFEVINDARLYWPRFVRVELEK